MYLSRIRPSAEPAQLRRIARIAAAGPYAIHRALWNLFENAPDTSRDFLFRQQGANLDLSFLLLSARAPGDDEGLWQVETKPFQPRLASGQRLAFSIRVNPVVRRRDGDGRQVRHDLVMDLKKQGNDDPEHTRAELVQQAAAQWLGSRQERHGFRLDAGRLIGESYRQWRFKGKNGREIAFSSLDCSGSLEVTDLEAFRKTLFNGLGPAKAFGCGLLLIRPA